MKRFSVFLFLLVAVVAVNLLATDAQANIVEPVDYWYRWGDGPGWQLIKDERGYGIPSWLDTQKVEIPNIEMPPPWQKTVWVELYWDDPIFRPSDPPNVELWYPGGLREPPDQAIPEIREWTLVWRLPVQPEYEHIDFDNPGYYHLGDPAYPRYIDFATYCIPEPSTLVLLSIGAIGLLAYAWRRRGR
jgi:hypothetical protein